MNFKKRVASALAAGSLLLQLVTPALAQVTIEISGNGSNSTNNVPVNVTTTTTVVQNNTANINNSVNASANTGGNDANDNTGGNVSVDTGDANVAVNVTNSVNANVAEVDCCVPGVDVLISGNGSDSNNTANLNLTSVTTVVQNNTADINNNITAKANTGWNDANDNTGGDVSIDTGDAETSVAVSNSGNSNSAKVSGDPGTISLRILGNGSESDNEIYLKLLKDLTLVQNNDANVNNSVYAKANTGKNDANDNTGGDVEIDTGDAKVKVAVDNSFNFNWADLDCGCILDVLAKIAGNGTDSQSEIKASLLDLQTVFQNNDFDCKRFDDPCAGVKAKADSGKNDAEDNTGGVDGGADPSIDTGNAETEVIIDNSANVNVVGPVGPDLPGLPGLPELPDLELGFNWSFFWWLAGVLG